MQGKVFWIEEEEDGRVMSYPIYHDFKFKVGDFVSSAFSRLAENGHVYQIVGRIYEESSGGVQLMYVCRAQSLFGKSEVLTLNEIEVVAYEPTVK